MSITLRINLILRDLNSIGAPIQKPNTNLLIKSHSGSPHGDSNYSKYKIV